MSLFLLSLTVIIPIPFCLFRMKKYDISLLKTIIIYVSFSAIGAFGACIGAYMSGEPITSVRLYGLIIFDSILLLLLSRIMKIDIGKMGDFVSVPIMVVCFSSKINCFIHGCCSGFAIYETQMGEIVRFPSVLFEMALWALLTVFLLIVEKNQKSTNTLWAIMVIWFGILRFIASCFRGHEKDFIEVLPGISGAKIWSLVVFCIGLIYMYYFLKRNLNRKPKALEFAYAMLGTDAN